uniref:Chitobiosyldiphosphodolichol beta-mannosyltransferase n=1 Tax=Haemonchus contortus TaxID=6289 RepID=A0A7I4YDA2_HAECO
MAILEEFVPYRRYTAAVVVLGDIGRSPRMCYHAYSLATQLDYDVNIVGYLDSTPHPLIHNNPHIKYVALSPPPDRLARLPEFLQLPLKFVWTFIVLSWALLFRVGWDVKLIFMQNPPALPTMFVCWMVSRLKSSKFVIDWHNYMWSILKDKSGIDQLTLPRLVEDGSEGKDSNKDVVRRKNTREERDTAVVSSRRKRQNSAGEKKERKTFKRRYIEWIYRWEGAFGRRADAGLCVTRAMREDLQRAWGVHTAVFYDRAPSCTFREFSLNDKHELLLRLGLGTNGQVFGAVPSEDATRFTIRDPSSRQVHLRDDRPLLVISSTSWTPDEDFQILLDAAKKYNDVAAISRSSSPATRLPIITLIITGRGPLKEFYMEKIQRMKMEYVEIHTPWLESQDYPLMIATADLGVSLHTSTSGLDLPMKVVDMFGAGIPVLAKRFNCIGELVQDGRNGQLFDTATDLFQHLYALATGFPTHCKKLHDLKQFVLDDSLPSWEENWATVAKPILAPNLDPHFERVMAREPAEEIGR